MTNQEISDVIIEYREALWKRFEKDFDDIKRANHNTPGVIPIKLYTILELKERMMQAEIEVLRKYFTKT